MSIVAPEQQISIVCDNPPLRVTGIRGSAAPLPTDGYGGWQTQDRPRRRALTWWSGSQPLEMKVAILFDGFDDQTDIEPQCADLESIARPATGEPPTVRVDGYVPHANLTWVITNLEWSDTLVEFADAGYRTRQEVTVTLLEHIADNRAALLPAAAKARQQALAQAQQTAPAARTALRTYTVRSGDSLERIASAELGDYRLWTVIADLNDIRDPAAIITGQVLLLP